MTKSDTPTNAEFGLPSFDQMSQKYNARKIIESHLIEKGNPRCHILLYTTMLYTENGGIYPRMIRKE